MRARAKNPRKPHEMTKAEKAWDANPLFAQLYDNRRYEAITLRFGKLRYTPDFSGTDRHAGQVHYFEIKASPHRAAYTEAARLKLKTFAAAFPEYVFMVCWPDKKQTLGWHIETISNEE